MFLEDAVEAPVYYQHKQCACKGKSLKFNTIHICIGFPNMGNLMSLAYHTYQTLSTGAPPETCFCLTWRKSKVVFLHVDEHGIFESCPGLYSRTTLPEKDEGGRQASPFRKAKGGYMC